MARVDIDGVAALLRDVAAQEILPRYRRLAASDIREKAPGDVVTAADEGAERLLTRRLPAFSAGSLVVGEEGTAADPGRIAALAGDAPVWVVDPVDGTQNFADGLPTFALMVALVQAGETLASWIYDPLPGRMAVAEAGGGAWLDGKRLRVAAPVPLEAMRGSLNYRFGKDAAARARMRGKRGRFSRVENLRCAGHEYLGLATGDRHFSLYSRLKPWDHAPGVLLHREAGGVAGVLPGGEAYRPVSILAGGLLLAPDAEGWDALRAFLFDMPRNQGPPIQEPPDREPPDREPPDQELLSGRLTLSRG